MRLLKQHGTPERASFAWKWGTNAAAAAHQEQVDADPYVQRFKQLTTATGLTKAEPLNDTSKKPIPVIDYSVKPDLKVLDPKFQGTGVAGTERNRANRVPRTYFYFAGTKPESVVSDSGTHLYHGSLPAGTKLYDLGKDHLGLNRPKWVQTKTGQEYRPVDFDKLERTLVKLGYHGYHNYHPGIPNAIAYFGKLHVQRAPNLIHRGTDNARQGQNR
jgi:hypothetical protein